MILAYYVQTSSGLGHAFRAHKILAHISRGAPAWRVFALTDSEYLLSLAAGHSYRAIPVSRLAINAAAVQSSDEHAKTLFHLLVNELHVDVFVVSHWRCLLQELRLLLPMLRKAGVKIALALRDIVGQPMFEHEMGRAYGIPLHDIISNYIDGIAIFGNENLHSILQESPAFGFSERLSYCGFIPPFSEAPPSELTESVIQCVVGGGLNSEELLETVIAAIPAIRRHRKVDQARFVTGPYCKTETVIRLHKLSSQLPGITVTSFDPHWYNDLPTSGIVICTGGYNTITEILFRGLRSICVPRNIPGIDEEQAIRARSLSEVATILTVSSTSMTSADIVNKLELIWGLPGYPVPRELFDPGRRFRQFLESI